MLFNEFLAKTSQIKEAELHPEKPFLEMTPATRLKIDYSKIDFTKAKKAAVLALFYPNEKNETCILLTLRASYNGTHSNQISFPGGKRDKEDKNSKETALRETFEEVGIQEIEIVKKLSKVYIPPSNFYVSPFLGYVEKQPKFHNNHEVVKTIELKVKDLLDSKLFTNEIIEVKYAGKMSVPCFKLGEYIIWGATAMMLNEIKYLIKFLK
ncbi:NUDIX hydrolase [Aureivirga marina]|uniref:NUDIX hydrolase n=1 Tax=Aureivirga marina TaxID=1182451 RepID=UPI0018C8EAD7|nr:CoA pyrophosphatase [Aureivirga marina]